MSQSRLRDAQSIVDFVLERVGQMARRPLMYGGSAEGVDVCFFNYLELWAFATGNTNQFNDARDKRYADANCHAMGFTGAYFHYHPSASEKAAAKFVVQQWLKIAESIGVPIPWKEIDEDLDDLRDYIERWWSTE